MKGKVITLSGSMKFWDEFIETGRRLSMDGHIILCPFKDTDPDNITEERKKMHEEVHNQRIDMCDELYVLNKNGYIGKSTINEILYAMKNNKSVSFMELMKPDQWKVILDRIERNFVVSRITFTLENMIEDLLGSIVKHVILFKADEFNFIAATREIHSKQISLMTLFESTATRMGTSTESYTLDIISASAIRECIDKLSQIYGIDPGTFPHVSMDKLLYYTPSELISRFLNEKI